MYAGEESSLDTKSHFEISTFAFANLQKRLENRNFSNFFCYTFKINVLVASIHFAQGKIMQQKNDSSAVQ